MTEQLDPKALELVGDLVYEMIRLRYGENNRAPSTLIAHKAVTAYLAASQPPVDGDVVERVARAICRAGICGPKAHLNEQEKLHWRKFELEAHAAIAAAYPALLARIVELEGERDGLRKSLECISRMRTFPDHKMNTFTLVAAHQLAENALSTTSKGSDVDE